jgi:hypothetical protein
MILRFLPVVQLILGLKAVDRSPTDSRKNTEVKHTAAAICACCSDAHEATAAAERTKYRNESTPSLGGGAAHCASAMNLSVRADIRRATRRSSPSRPHASAKSSVSTSAQI